MSQILTIYENIAGWDLEGIRTTRNITEIKNAVKAGALPIRLLMPFLKQDQHFIGIGPTSKASWYIRDLMLWQAVAKGSGIEQCGLNLVEYLADYTIAIRAGRQPAPNAVIKSVTMTMGWFPWNETNYWGVEVILTVEEVLIG